MASISFITDLGKNNLSGWQKNDIVVSNNPDPRAMDFDFRSRVRHNWPSQRPWFYRRGYISFYNGKRFDLGNQTIGLRKKYLFFFHEVRFYWERFELEGRVTAALKALPELDRRAAIDLIAEATERPATGRPINADVALRALSALGLIELRVLEAILGPRPDAADATGKAA